MQFSKVRFMKWLVFFSLIVSFIFPATKNVYAIAHDPNDQLYDYGIRTWEDQTPELGFYINAAARYTLETVENPQMGSIAGEWSVMNLLRGMYTGYDYISHIPNNYFKQYIKHIEEYVQMKEGNLDRNKSTEWSRLILALSALDYDIRDVAGYDFIDRLSQSYKFSYRQGINGPIWEIIAMNTGPYQFVAYEYEDANNFGKMIDYILEREITMENGERGGWALFGKNPDPDITGMALQAFAPYYKNKEKYEETGASASYDEFVQAVERGVYALSQMQEANGAFAAFGNVNAESTVQAIVALTALGIDPKAETVRLESIGKIANFKTGEGAEQDGVVTNNMIDALLTFWADGSGSQRGIGGFKHVTTGFDGGGGAGTGVNAMATDQALYGLIAYDRFLKEKNPLYDMTDMMTAYGGIPYTQLKARSLHMNLYYDEQDQEGVKTSPYAIITIPEGKPLKGMEFRHWTSQKEGKGTIYEAGELFSMPDQDITLYAQYEPITYRIQYELNGGTVHDLTLPSTYTVQDEIILPAGEALEKSGHLFDGWYDNPSFEGKKLTKLAKGSTEDLVLYAKWREVEDVDEAAIQSVMDLIEALPTIDEINLEDQDEISRVRQAFDELTAKEQALVRNIGSLEMLEEKLLQLLKVEKDRTVAAELMRVIEELPDLSQITLADQAFVMEVRLMFENLTEDQKKLVRNIDRLALLEAELEVQQEKVDLEIAKEFEQILSQVPAIEDISIEDREQISEIINFYHRLTPSQLALIQGIDRYRAIESKWFELEEIENNRQAAKKVELMIDQLPSLDEVELNTKSMLEQIREAYEQLTQDQKQLVSNLSYFIEVEERFAQLEQALFDEIAANEVIYQIETLLSFGSISLSDKEEIQLVRQAYEDLTEAQKQLVYNIAQLEDLEEKLEKLEAEKVLLDQQKAEEIEREIEALPTIDQISLSDEEMIKKLRERYMNLTEAQRKLVSNIDKLVQLEEKLQALAKAEMDQGHENEEEESDAKIEGEKDSTKDLPKESLKHGRKDSTKQVGKAAHKEELTTSNLKPDELKKEEAPTEKGQELPSTATVIFNMMVMGLALMTFGFILSYFKKQQD